MEKTRYDYLDIPYLYQMSLGQILRVIGIQKAEIFQPSLKKNVGLQLSVSGSISHTDHLPTVLPC